MNAVSAHGCIGMICFWRLLSKDLANIVRADALLPRDKEELLKEIRLERQRQYFCTGVTYAL